MDNYKITQYHWTPIKEVHDSLVNYCKEKEYKNILEIGPGYVPFELATISIGCNEKIKDYIDLDIDTNKLPFEDKSIDFVYSRHTLEDIQNPDFALNEIIRISKSGYIETPSPLIETTKGVDSSSKKDNYAGYIHHRYIVWSDIEKCEIYFLPKYNSILDNFMSLNVNSKYYENKYYWNNYFIWNETKKPKIIMYKNGVNIGGLNDSYGGSSLLSDYINLINEALNTSIKNTEYFLQIMRINSK